MKELLKFDNLCLTYGRNIILDHVSASISERDFIVLTGPNGGGKTTLLQIIAGLLPPTAGSIVCRPGLTLGYLPQYRGIDRDFPITVGEVVLSGLQNRKRLFTSFSRQQKEQVDRVLERLQISQFKERPIKGLSGGQWQRVLLGRAIVSQPDLLLLDEPDTHLDLEGKDFLYNLLREENNHSAVLLVSHDATVSNTTIWEVKDGLLRPVREIV